MTCSKALATLDEETPEPAAYATGIYLDNIGALFEVERKPNEPDDDFRLRIHNKLNDASDKYNLQLHKETNP